MIYMYIYITIIIENIKKYSNDPIRQNDSIVSHHQLKSILSILRITQIK